MRRMSSGCTSLRPAPTRRSSITGSPTTSQIEHLKNCVAPARLSTLRRPGHAPQEFRPGRAARQRLERRRRRLRVGQSTGPPAPRDDAPAARAADGAARRLPSRPERDRQEQRMDHAHRLARGLHDRGRDAHDRLTRADAAQACVGDLDPQVSRNDDLDFREVELASCFEAGRSMAALPCGLSHLRAFSPSRRRKSSAIRKCTPSTRRSRRSSARSSSSRRQREASRAEEEEARPGRPSSRAARPSAAAARAAVAAAAKRRGRAAKAPQRGAEGAHRGVKGGRPCKTAVDEWRWRRCVAGSRAAADDATADAVWSGCGGR